MKIYFSDYFEVDPKEVEKYGAFNISLVTDLPLFVDPFLLFNSKEKKYRELHSHIIDYLKFLKKKSSGHLSDGLVRELYAFPEVKQNWLGFTETGNAGGGLGKDFAVALNDNLHKLFPNFGQEKITRGSHLEKLCLIKEGVGKDTISDFTVNLIKGYLAEYTQEFAARYIDKKHIREVAVDRATFNFETESWATITYELPYIDGDFVLLTPKSILTKEDTWINRGDLVSDFPDIPDAIPNEQLRAKVSNYFKSLLSEDPTKPEIKVAVESTILKYPETIDYHIKLKEEKGENAVNISAQRVAVSQNVYVEQFGILADKVESETDFKKIEGDTYEESLRKVHYLKDVIENKGGHRLFYVDGVPIRREKDLHIMYRLTWEGTPSDVSSEVNDGRGPADNKISRGAKDKTIVEFKLAQNLKKNVNKQVRTYLRASDAKKGIVCVLHFSESEYTKAKGIFEELGFMGKENLVFVDAMKDNKPSGSKA